MTFRISGIAGLTLSALLASSIAVTAQSTPGRAQSAAPAAKPVFKELSRAEFDALIQTPEKIVIVDLRRPDELQSIGTFPVFLNIQPDTLEKSLAYIPRDRTVIAVSNHVSRSGRAAALLKERGFKVAGAIGAQTYEESGGTLVKIARPEPRQATSASTPSTK